MPTVDIKEVKIYYEVHGEGNPLLMIQGYGGSSEDWNSQEPRAMELSKHYKVILIDSRGTGRSSASTEEFTIEAMADDAAALLDHLKLSRAHVLGTSMGGMIAQELAIKYPEKVDGLLLLYTGPGGHLYDLPGQRESLRKLSWSFKPPVGMSPEDVTDEILRLAYYKDYLTLNRDKLKSAVVEYPTPSSTLERQYNAIMRFDSTGRLDLIKSKTLILHGWNDLLIFPEAARFLADHISDSELLMFERAGHVLSEERWPEVKGLILGFLFRIDESKKQKSLP
jgi:pimeloyl-ACP methyl ester carboxylesterase